MANWLPTNEIVDINDLASAIAESIKDIKFEDVILASSHDFSEIEKFAAEKAAE